VTADATLDAATVLAELTEVISPRGDRRELADGLSCWCSSNLLQVGNV
jgi:hypothetical protein